MSLILDALSRSAQDDAQRDRVPGIDSVHTQPAEQTSGSMQRWLIAVLVALVLALIAALLWPNGAEDQQLMPANVEMPGHAAPQPQPQPQPEAEIIAAESEAEVTALSTAQPEPAVQATDPADPQVQALYQSQTAQTSAQQIDAADDASERASPEATAVEPAPVTLDVDELVAQAQAEVGKSRLSEHSAPLLDALSQQRKDEIPSLFYSRHDYTRGGDVAVVINGKNLQPGDTAAPGVKLVEILPDSAVFQHRGETFRLRALNSWVNL